MIRQASSSAVGHEGLWYGYPAWIVVLLGTVVAAGGLWLFSKIVKWLLIVAIVVVLAGGVVWAVRLYLA